MALLWPETRSGTSVTSEVSTPISPTEEPPKSSPGRVLLGPNLTPQYLAAQMDGKTAYQSERLLEIYIGKWMRVRGPIENISTTIIDNIMIVTLDVGNSMKAGLYFDKSKWLDHLSILPVGATILAAGKIRKVERFWIWLNECDLED